MTDAPSSPTPSSSRGTVALVAATIACAIGLGAVLSTNDPFLSNDGPSHASSRFIHDHVDDPRFGFSKFYVANDPWSARGFDEMFAVVERATGSWRIALDVTTIAIAELWAFGFFAVVVALDRRRAPLGLLGFGFAIQVVMYVGLYTFFVGTAVGLFALALGLSPRSLDDKRAAVTHYVALAVLLVITAHCHIVALGITGLALGAVSIARASSVRSAAIHVVALFIASLPSLAIAFLARGAIAEHEGAFNLVWNGVLDRTLFVERSFQPAGVVRPLVTLAFVVAGAFSFARSARGSRDDVDGARREERGLFVIGVAFVLLSMIVPRDFMSWQLANVRFLPMGTVALVALFSIERMRSRVRVVAVASVAAYVLGSFAWALSFHRELMSSTQNALAPLNDDRLKPVARDWLPVITKPYGDHDDDWGIDGFVPLLHVADLYQMKLGGAVEYGQTELHSIHTALRVAERDGEVPPKELWLDVLHASSSSERTDRLRLLLISAQTREGILYYGEPQDRALLDDMGFVADYADRGFYAGRFEGCDAVFTLDANIDVQVSVEVGAWPRKTPTEMLAAHLAATGASSVSVPHFACGDVWLRVPGHRCNGAPASTPVRAHFARGTVNTLRCTLDDAAAAAPP